MEKSECKLILFQIGSPASLNEDDIKTYLYDFLSNKKVVDLPHLFWLPLLKYIILPIRSQKLLNRYEKIWDGKEFLLPKQTRLLCEKLRPLLFPQNIECDYAFYYGKKTVNELVKEIELDQKIFFLPLFPQYGRATWGIAEDYKKENIKFLSPFYAEDFYIDNVYKMIEKKLSKITINQKVDAVLISFHSVPIRQIQKFEDPYLKQCEITFTKLKAKLENRFRELDVVMCFQSKFGKGEWASPLLSDLVMNKYKGKNVVVASPSFVSDSLETVVEINEELKEIVELGGGKLHYVECLNFDDEWVRGLLEWIINGVS